MGLFEKYRPVAYPYNFIATLRIGTIAGGTPTNEKVAEGWLRSKLGVPRDDLIREEVAKIMLERGVTAEQAAAELSDTKHLNGFRRDSDGVLFIEGRQIKAAIKEAANIRWPKDRWGPSRKGTQSFFSEHVFVLDDKVSLGVTDCTSIAQRFVHTWRGSAIQYEETVDDAEISFRVTTDFEFSDEQWGLLWLTGEQQGIGASRSQGYGRYEIIGWEAVSA